MEKKYKLVDLSKEVQVSIEDIMEYYGWTKKYLVKTFSTSEELYNNFLDKAEEMIEEKYDKFTPVVIPFYKTIEIWAKDLMDKKNPLEIFLNVPRIRKQLKKWVEINQKIKTEGGDETKLYDRKDMIEDIIKEYIDDKIFDLTFVNGRFKIPHEERGWNDENSNYNIAKKFNREEIFNKIINKLNTKYQLGDN